MTKAGKRKSRKGETSHVPVLTDCPQSQYWNWYMADNASAFEAVC
jgi:hypothetical protein